MAAGGTGPPHNREKASVDACFLLISVAFGMFVMSEALRNDYYPMDRDYE